MTSRSAVAESNPAGNLAAAHRAIKAGRDHEARHLLYDYLKRVPGDYRAWLMLAGIAPSPQDSLECVQRAAALRPGDPTVEEARRWAQQRLGTQPDTSSTAARTFPAVGDFLFILAAALLLLALILFQAEQSAPPLAGLRLLLALFLVLVAPGYALQVAVFPRQKDLDTIDRAALSIGLSLAVLPLLALALDRLPWGLRLWPIVVAAGLVTLLFSLAALIRRRGLRQEIAFRPELKLDFERWWSLEDRSSRVLYGVLLAGLLIAFFAAAAILILPSPAEQFSEFYLLGPEGLAESFPQEAFLGQDLSVTIGITNLERGAHSYRVQVWAQDRWETNQRAKVAEFGPFVLRRGEGIEQLVNWQMPWIGQDQKVEFLLFMDDRPEPYRGLRLWLDVKP